VVLSVRAFVVSKSEFLDRLPGCTYPTNKFIMKKLLLLIICLHLFSVVAPDRLTAQEYRRIRADFTVKAKTASGEQSLTVGQVFYDRSNKQVIYQVSFPEKECWVIADSMIYQIKDNLLVQKTSTFSVAEFTIFHLALNSQLQDFGLKSTRYTPGNINKDGEMVITTWIPPSSVKKRFGNILISVKAKQLYGVVFLNPEGTVLRKQFFEQYQVINGLAFPDRIVEINIVNGQENYQITSYKNVMVDEKDNHNQYYYPVNHFRQ